jgi:hypothetical protein
VGLVRATIVCATALWAIVEILKRRRPNVIEPARQLWTGAVLLAIVHATAAFETVYGWSHQSALVATVLQTELQTGLAWGGGLYVNYAFLTIWAADAMWWWLSPASYLMRDARLERARLALFTFMFVNGAIVFAGGIARGVGIVAVGSVCAAWAFGERRSFRHA